MYDVRGLGADTMHMARLWDSARAKEGGYSLATLTEQLLDAPKITMKVDELSISNLLGIHMTHLAHLSLLAAGYIRQT